MKKYNDLIVEALEPLEIPLYYAEIPEDVLANMNYIYYSESSLQRLDVRFMLQYYEVAYVSQYKEDLQEEDFIEAMEAKGFKFVNGQYDRLKLSDTSDFIDVFVMIYTRKVKRRKCGE